MRVSLLVLIIGSSLMGGVHAENWATIDGSYWKGLTEEEKEKVAEGMVLGVSAVLMWMSVDLPEGVRDFPIEGDMKSAEIAKGISDWYEENGYGYPLVAVYYIVNGADISWLLRKLLQSPLEKPKPPKPSLEI